MQNFARDQIFRRSPHSHHLPPRHQSQAGFTLVEILVVVGLIAVLSAIAAPSWLGFVQQRRVTSANDAVVRAIQEAQSNAKTKKLRYSVSFRNKDGVPQVAVYPQDSADANKNSLPPDNNWKQLGEQLSLKSGQVLLGTNIDNVNSTPGAAISYTIPTNAKITFDYTGGFPISPTPNLSNNGLIMVVAAPQPNTTQPIPSTIRCVSVKTLLGSIQAGKIDSTTGQCNPI